MRGVPLHTVRCRRGMRRSFWFSMLAGLSLIVLIVLIVLGAGALMLPETSYATAITPQAQEPEALVDEWVITSVADWQQGEVSGLLISNNNGGELRLDAGFSEGTFVSNPFSTTFALNAAGAFWQAQLPQGTALSLDIRGRSTPPSAEEIIGDAGWSPWYPLLAGDARSQTDIGAFATPDVLRFPADTIYLQLRVNFRSDIPRASAVLEDITIAYINTTEGPPTSPGLPRVPISVGPETLTPPPVLVQRPTWSARRTATRPTRLDPRGIIVHQIDVPPGTTDILSFLRAMTVYQTEVLGWDDLVYHYLIDNAGTLYEGRLGGPTASVSRLAGGDTAVHVALIGDRDQPPDAAAQQTLVDLLAWLGEAYNIEPNNQHDVLVNDRLVARSNIAAHSEVAPEAPDPGQPLLELLPELRTRANRAMVRARWYFIEGNIQDYTQELTFFHPEGRATDVVVSLFPDGILEPVTRTVSLEANGRTNLLVNDVVSDTVNLTWIVESSQPVIVERTIALPGDIDIRPGADSQSRVWYFAEGATSESFQTFLLLFNPQDSPADATITYMRGDGSMAEQSARLPARQQLAINVGDVLPDEQFGIRVVATQPIVAERTMRFGAGGRGLHTTPGMSALSRDWYFAEGSTQAPFDMRLLLLNPNRQPAIASVTFMTPDGTSLTRRYVVPATTRLSVDVNEVVPELGVATVVQSDRPVAAERAIYLNPTDTAVPTNTSTLTQTLPLIGSVSHGAIEPTYSWSLADGRLTDAEQYILISNPSRGQARVTVEFLLSNDNRSVQNIVMPAGSRYTLPVNELYPDESSVAVLVRATQPVVVERSIFPTAGRGAGGASTALGVPGS